MNRLLLLALFLSSTALGQEINGNWLVYDIQEKEKFILRLGRASRGYGEGGDTTMGRRSLSTRFGKLKYNVRGREVNFYEKDTGAFFMGGTLNSDGTELSGQFASGGVFAAKKQGASAVFQVVWLAGAYRNKSYCMFDGDDESSIKLECRATGGTYYELVQNKVFPYAATSRFDKGSPANWLLKPNTFLDSNSCQKKAEEFMAKSRCGLLRGDK